MRPYMEALMTLSDSEIQETLKQFVVSNFFLDLTTMPLENDTSFLESGIIDSTGILEVINFIQERFAIEMADDELLPENLDCIKNISTYILRKKAGTGVAG
jgi:acyl carrier protein